MPIKNRQSNLSTTLPPAFLFGKIHFQYFHLYLSQIRPNFDDLSTTYVTVKSLLRNVFFIVIIAKTMHPDIKDRIAEVCM